MSVTDPLSVVNTYLTDVNGLVKVCGLTPGTYTVAETIDFNVYSLVAVLVNGVSVNPPNPAPTYSFTWTANTQEPFIVFENTDAVVSPPV